MDIRVNGEVREVGDGLSVEDLVRVLDLGGERVAVERNLEIVPRGAWRRVRLAEGDRVEIIHFVGGG